MTDKFNSITVMESLCFKAEGNKGWGEKTIDKDKV